MKTSKVSRIAAMAVLMVVGLTSCTKETPQYELVADGKKIVKLEISSSYFGYSIYKFNYDNDGKLIEVICNDDEGTQIINYIWNNDAIQSSLGVYRLKDGLIRNWADYRDVTYSSRTGQVYEIKSSSSYSYNYTFIWDSNSGGLSRRDAHYKQGNRSTIHESFSLGYDESSEVCNNFNPIFPILLSSGFDGDLLCVAHPELVAARSIVIPQSFTLEDFWQDENGRLDSEKIRGTCGYKLDSDGYLIECTMNENNSNYDAYKAKYTITWK